jgi:hypothetical protein
VNGERVKRVLLSLSDAAYRLAWLRSEIERSALEDVAVLLDGLSEQSERSDPQAREAMLTVAMLFAALGECELTQRLREQAAGQHLLSLDRLLRAAPTAEEPVVCEPRVPDYGFGRELTLGERRSLARRPNRRHLEKLLADPHPMVVRQLLHNPKLTEEDVVRLAARRPARIVALREIAASPRWLCRPRVRLSIVLNPGSPPTMSMPLLGLCTRAELVSIIESGAVPLALRATARELLERRPPLEEPDRADVMLQ